MFATQQYEAAAAAAPVREEQVEDRVIIDSSMMDRTEQF